MDRFTDEQLREYNDAFCMFDKSDLGYILSTELRDMLKTIGINPTDNLLENMMIVVDQDSNGKIEFTEFIDLIDKLENKEKNDIEGNARAAFNAFDFMGKGFIPAFDIKEALKFLMVKSTVAEQEEVIKHFKLERNRKVYFREFKDMIELKR